MAEYTPTTAEIREYVEVGGEPRPWEEITPETESKEAARAAAFDRWLAAHDAQVLRDAAEDWEALVRQEKPPVRGAIWLNARADRNQRSEERRDGKEWGSKCRYRGWP